MTLDMPPVAAHPQKRSRATNKLNPLLIKAAQQTAIETRKVLLLSDGGGLYLRIEANGNARWTYRYTRTDGTRGERGLGSFSQVSLKAARELVQVERERLQQGLDPVEARQDDRRAAKAVRSIPTFGAAADTYVAEKVAPRSTNAKALSQWGQTLGASYCAAIRDKRIDQITVADILAVLLQLTVKKRLGQAPVTGALWHLKPVTASRLLDRIRRVLDWATVEGWRTGDNPARWSGLLEHKLSRKSSSDVRHHPSLHYREVPGFVSALQPREAASARALEFLILTACRSGEVRGATWEEFDLVSRVWTIPPARMKARAEHRVPLTERMIEIVTSMQPDPEKRQGLIFRNSIGGVMSDMVFKALMERMGKTGITAHGFRSSFRNWAGDEHGAPDDVAEAALAHSYGTAVQRAYRGSPAFKLRVKLMNAWGQYCASQEMGTNVVTLKPPA